MSSLPVILVSAKSEAAALHIITQIIDIKEPLENGDESEAEGSGRTWCIQNKYYTADVCLLPAPDGQPPPHTAPEAHIIYLAEDECTVEIASSRENAGADAEVRVLAAECAQLPAALAAWAARNCFEPVPLREQPSSEDKAEELGVAAARASLHAHAWPGLRRSPRTPSDPGSADELERAEQSMAALSMLGDAARAVRQLPSAGERRLAAEQLMAVLCRALGEDLDTL